MSDTPRTDILHDHCHIDNTPAPEAIETWVESHRALERDLNAMTVACKATLDNFSSTFRRERIFGSYLQHIDPKGYETALKEIDEQRDLE